MKKAFTVVEVMIVVVILMLLAAMAIPAFQKVKYVSLEKAYKSGQSMTAEEIKYMREYRASHEKDFAVEVTVAAPAPEPVSTTHWEGSFQILTVDGKTYILVPKQDAQESVIAGKTYWLIPRHP